MPGQSYAQLEAGEANVDTVLSSNDDKITYGSVKKLGLPQRSLASLRTITMCILVVELCERLAFYTFTGTQEFFLERHGYSLSQAGGVNDAIGALVAAIAAWPVFNYTGLYLFGVMVLVPMGTAGIKANISNFGADQFDTSVPAQKDAQEKFFSWFYLAINLGSAVAYGYLTTMGSNGGLGVQKSYGYFSVYVIAALCMLLAIYIFRSGKHQYRMQPVQSRSSLGAVARYVTDAAGSGSGHAVTLLVGFALLTAGVAFSVVQAILPEAYFASF